MTWTGRADSVSCCGDDPGAVADGEVVARVLHNKITVPEGVPFTREQLTWRGKKDPFENACGLADGVSVDRCSDLSDDEIRQRAVDQAGPGRTPQGAIIAEASALRQIRSPIGENAQVVYIYDDPMPNNRHHAVIRVLETLGRPAFDFVRSEIEKAFRHRKVEP